MFCSVLCIVENVVNVTIDIREISYLILDNENKQEPLLFCHKDRCFCAAFVVRKQFILRCFRRCPILQNCKPSSVLSTIGLHQRYRIERVWSRRTLAGMLPHPCMKPGRVPASFWANFGRKYRMRHASATGVLAPCLCMALCMTLYIKATTTGLRMGPIQIFL